MTFPTVDRKGKPFTERDIKLLALLLRPKGAQRFELNEAIMKRVLARNFVRDSARLAARLNGEAWADSPGLGDTRRFCDVVGIRPAKSDRERGRASRQVDLQSNHQIGSRFVKD